MELAQLVDQIGALLEERQDHIGLRRQSTGERCALGMNAQPGSHAPRRVDDRRLVPWAN